MLRRKAYGRLMEWKGRDHMCLLVSGQRQVGKTFIIERFGEDNYDHVVRIDLTAEVSVRDAFKGDLDVDSVVRKIGMYRPDAVFVPGSTLLILDEIQDCPRARTSLKYFSEDGRYDVIATGSLLGVDLGNDAEDAPVPVGYEEHMTMHSLDFEEFLWANGISGDAIEHIRGCVRDRAPMGEAVVNCMNTLLRDFMIVGGMPKAVSTFLEENSYRAAGAVLDTLIEQAKADMNRYNTPVDGAKVSACFDSIPSQLSESNKKFMYSRVSGEGSRRSAEKYYSSLEWIVGAGYANLCHRLVSLEPPLMAREEKGQFRVYLSDTGMLMRMYGEPTIRATYSDDLSYNMGAIVENMVAECLMKSGHRPRYYMKNKDLGRMELDFVVESGSEIMAIEVKSGKHREYPSLGKVRDFHRVDRRVVLERSDVHVSDDGVEHYPLFCAAFLDSMEAEWDGPEF